MQEREVELFGGAITCALPTTAVDVSEFRQVPDTQEVYAEAETGMCIIVELLSRQRELSDADCGEFFYKDLAHANGCVHGDYTIQQQRQLVSSEYPHVSQLPPEAAPQQQLRRDVYGCLVCGLQRVSKYTNEKGKENDVLVALAVLRLPPPISTDVLLSISAPQRIHPESSEAHVVQRLRGEAEVLALLQRMLLTLNVRNWGLFVPED
ncbi:Ran-binding protein [Trypanosoma grayi]|uniref:Ran-binding protein n=1 Tax=Trypanosoma grayi TaxID=71804 RepID=UPI0004F4BE1F|nr:Ran-binding protein [Trypanosoma grayi]KEG14447.1 Ran-binding protein [Trypanosoma grayi]